MLRLRKGAYYNENDPKMAAWLRALIAAGLIAEGDVDARSIVDVRPGDLRDYIQCHFFAGIGGWSYALRLADWDDTRPCWTGSCPCQPFSSAGKGDGADDSRHLWPAWFELIRQCRPAVIFGEQVASADGLGWLDLVSHDLEGADYAIGAADLCAPCVGAFDIRQRLWFVAQPNERQSRHGDIQRSGEHGLRAEGGYPAWDEAISKQSETGIVADTESERGQRLSAEAWTDLPDGAGRCEAGELADTKHSKRWAIHEQDGRDRANRGRSQAHGESGACSEVRELGHTTSCGRSRQRPEPAHAFIGQASPWAGGVGWLGIANGDNAAEECEGDGIVGGQRATERRRQQQHAGAGAAGRNGGGSCAEGTPARGHGNDTAAARSFWADAEWIPCTDGKWRPVEPGTFPLAHGVPARVGRLRGYGNAIKPQVAALFIRAYRDVVE